MNETECQLAAIVTQNDFKHVLTQPQYGVLFQDGSRTKGVVKNIKNNNMMLYKLKQKDDTLVLKIKPIANTTPAMIDMVDLNSYYLILKSRGCEDAQPHFAKHHTITVLKQRFERYFQPDNIKDLLFLYMDLHMNVALATNKTVTPTKMIFMLNQLPPQVLLDEIRDLYNTLYIVFELNHF